MAMTDYERRKRWLARMSDEDRKAFYRDHARRAYRRRRARLGFVVKPQEPRTETRVRTCASCEAEFTVARTPSGRSFRKTKTCSVECRQELVRQVAESRRGQPSPNRGRAPWNKGRRSFGQSCPVIYADCVGCGRTFITHRGTRSCSDGCRRRHSREYSREYQRRTKATAIRYWRIAPTPEAQALAATYYELRQTLRGMVDFG